MDRDGMRCDSLSGNQNKTRNRFNMEADLVLGENGTDYEYMKEKW